MGRDAARAATPRVRVRLTSDARAPAEARRALRGLPLGRRADDVVLLTSELVTNAVEHACLEPGQTIELSATCDGDCTRVEVRDEGRGFGGPERGLGLTMVAAAAERWGIEHHGDTRVWFELPR